jgi:hypothetical protein
MSETHALTMFDVEVGDILTTDDVLYVIPGYDKRFPLLRMRTSAGYQPPVENQHVLVLQKKQIWFNADMVGGVLVLHKGRRVAIVNVSRFKKLIK